MIFMILLIVKTNIIDKMYTNINFKYHTFLNLNIWHMSIAKMCHKYIHIEWLDIKVINLFLKILKL